MDTAYVITWRYSDGSDSGATAVFTDKARAERLVEILDKTDSMRQFKIEAVPFDLGNTPAPKEAPCEASRGDLFTVQIDHLRDQRGLTYQVNIARADRSRPLPSYIPALMCVHETQRMENAAHTAAEWSLFLNGAPATPGTPGGGR